MHTKTKILRALQIYFVGLSAFRRGAYCITIMVSHLPYQAQATPTKDIPKGRSRIYSLSGRGRNFVLFSVENNPLPLPEAKIFTQSKLGNDYLLMSLTDMSYTQGGCKAQCGGDDIWGEIISPKMSICLDKVSICLRFYVNLRVWLLCNDYYFHHNYFTMHPLILMHPLLSMNA